MREVRVGRRAYWVPQTCAQLREQLLLYGGGVAFAFLALVALRHMWGWYLLLSRDYGVELGVAAVVGLALVWVVRESLRE